MLVVRLTELGPLRASAEDIDGDEAVGLVTDEMVEEFFLVGTADRCKERISEYRKAGVDLPLLLPRLDDFDRVAHSLSDPQ
jgi:alkanesulfonate monooxygenase SsuD/methylene tetrahydromethanopterin reductase-like flavin-dependent oxidoreductase (luciferase family)